MITRRHLLGLAATTSLAILPSREPTGERPSSPMDGPPEHRGPLPRLLTGLPEIDAATAGISIGGLTAIVGHGCSGKSELAYAIARSVCQHHFTNVLMLSAREPADWIARESHCWPMHADVPTMAPASWTKADCNAAIRGFPRGIYLGPYSTWPDVVALMNNTYSNRTRDCELIILDGFGTEECEPVPRVIDTPNGPALVDPNSWYTPTRLTQERVRELARFAAARKIAVIVTLHIPTFADNDPARCTVTATDHPLRDAIRLHCDRTLWLLRPKVWDKNIPEDTLEILTRWDSGQEYRQSLLFRT